MRNSRSTWLVAARSTETNSALAYGGAGNGLCGVGQAANAVVRHLSVFGFILAGHAVYAVVGPLPRLVLSGLAVDATVGRLPRELALHAAEAVVRHLGREIFVLSGHAADAVVGALGREVFVFSGRAADAGVGPLLRELSGHAILAGRVVGHIIVLAGLALIT